MADTGAPYFIPYVEPTDLVRDYPAADEASADAIAAALDAIPVLAGIGSNVVQTVKTDVFTMVSTTFASVTGLEATITPTTASSKILIVAQVAASRAGLTGTRAGGIRLTGGNTASYIGDAAGSAQQVVASIFFNPGTMGTYTMVFLDSPAATVATTYGVEVNARSVAMVINADGGLGTGSDSHRGASSITLIEVAA